MLIVALERVNNILLSTEANGAVHRQLFTDILLLDKFIRASFVKGSTDKGDK